MLSFVFYACGVICLRDPQRLARLGGILIPTAALSLLYLAGRVAVPA